MKNFRVNMDLIPIIEYTLLIFIGLLLLVIVSSYIIFLMRKKYNNEEQEQGYAREYLTSDPEVKYLIPVRNEESARQNNGYYNSGYSENNNRPGRSGRFTVINTPNPDAPSYAPERVDSFNHRFAPSKSKDAFAMFK